MPVRRHSLSIAKDLRLVEITFSNKAGGEFYKQVQNAIDEGDEQPFFDFSHMVENWEVPAEQPKGQADPVAKLVAA